VPVFLPVVNNFSNNFSKNREIMVNHLYKFGHKPRSVFDLYNIISETGLMLAAQKTETYLQAQKGTVSGTVTKIEKKRGQAVNA
jgi:hypothetical protein